MKGLWRCIDTLLVSRVARGRSAGTVLAHTLTVSLISALVYHVASSPPQRSTQAAVAHGAPPPALPTSEWWREINDHPILTLLAIVLAVSAYGHSQRFVALGLSILAAAVRDASDANKQVAASFDELLGAVNDWASRRRSAGSTSAEENTPLVLGGVTPRVTGIAGFVEATSQTGMASGSDDTVAGASRSAATRTDP
jgi:hypothetical protein